MPINGILHVKSDKKVIVQPGDQEYRGLEVVIENIKATPSLNGKSIRAGDNIGVALKAPVCGSQNSIHISVRKEESEKMDDRDYDYIDPTSYLDRFIPVPMWIQECMDKEFRYYRVIFDFVFLKRDRFTEYLFSDLGYILSSPMVFDH